MNWLDWVLILVITLSALRGLSTGFFAGVARLLGLILGIAAAFTCYRRLAAYLDAQWGWGDSIAGFLINHFSNSLLPDLAGKISMDGLQQTIPGSLDSIAHQLALSVLEFISFVLILLAVAMVVKIIMQFFSGAVAHTFLSPLDHIGGLLLGLARGLVIVLLVALFLEPVLSTGVMAGYEQNGAISRAVAGSLLIPYAYQILDVINLHFPLSASPVDLIVMHGCRYI
ncbi:CvpA family protein [Desulfallas thermosapovorans]|uniref:Colicin V production protein n=1 Tax=Desulfallas thermosapovorans DSM 6562 TaxID=1121431 RepID=A0A5S4ZTV4_9FIRM|nr:CvpA family protein [Desulfallas thermosapovorans]TYO96430.1 colicin V production protein [Desulfallas thermosapovorans DSM 6562]